MQELREEMQTTVNSIVADFNKEIHAPSGDYGAMVNSKLVRPMLKPTRRWPEALEAHIKVRMAAMANGGTVQVTTTSKANTSIPPIFNEVKSVMEIDNFICRLKAYFAAMGIGENAQKLSNASLFLKDISLVWWHYRCDANRGSDPIDTWDWFKT